MTVQLIVFLFFMAVLLGLLFLYSMIALVRRSPSYELRKRLRKLAVKGDERISSELASEVLLEMTPFDKALLKYSLIMKLDRLIDSSGVKADLKWFSLVMFMTGVAGFCAGLLFRRGFIIPVILMIIGFFAPLLYLRVKRNKRNMKFTELFPGTLEMIARSLKAGHSLSSAIQLVGMEVSDPVGTLFKTAYEVQTLGLSMRDALAQMLERMPGVDLQLFVTSVNIHWNVGGNLADSLERLAHLIRERLRIRRQVKVYSAQARLSSIILVVLPVFMAVFFYLFLPGHMEELLTSDLGRYGIAFAVIGQCLGFLVIRKIVNIRI
jgi:tight adherence protein B